MTLRLTTPPHDVDLRAWSDVETRAWSQITSRALEVKRSTGRGSSFEAILTQAREILAGPTPASHPDLKNRKMKRAVVTVWAENPAIAEKSLRSDIFSVVAPLDEGRSTLLVLALANVYYRYFDLLDEWEEGLFNTVGTRLVALGRRQRERESADIFTALSRERRFVIGPRAPERIAAVVRESGEPLTSYLQRIGLGDYGKGRFVDIVRQYTYLERIKHAEPTEPHDFLTELTSTQLKKAPTSDRRMFGHVVVEAMTKNAVTEPHVEWRNTIIDIAGDPRARGTTEWNTWWALIDEKSRSRVIAWLATQDLQLFLDAVEAYGEREYDWNLKRMFPDRKRLLQGLQRQNLIKETRLIAAKEARAAIRLQLGTELRTEITPLVGRVHSQLSVIYIDCGDFHIVEGSHNFKLWVFAGERPHAFSTWSRASYDVFELRNPKYGENTTHESFVHSQGAKWIADALMFLADHGIYLNPEKLMSPDTYEAVNQKFELPVQNHRSWR